MATSSIQAANLFNVKGLVAVVTGGGSGIGLMMTRALALNGAEKVYIIGRRKEVLESAASSVDTGNIIPIVGDVTDKEAVASIVSKIESEVGYINVLIANSGIAGPQATKPITPSSSVSEFASSWGSASMEEMTKTFELNTVAVFSCIMAFLNLLDKGNKKGNVEQKSQVVATSSIGGFNRKAPGGIIYGQSKAATTHLMKQLSTQLAPYEIRCNTIAPGLFPSEMAAGLIGDGVFAKDQIPLQRAGTEEDMAGCILFLTSRAGAYCTHAVIVVDGGRLSVMPSTW
ncbi:putative short chain dehydrogenase reductase family protein [Botrytis fragariae]|uniref:Putative short chain dehydrogenase reductase family protein n=1 Tax=Botrytis fragariae TaxID=1964551 RepID=A0A8H6AJZ9_9HELO|nr:putative short chain dehydrogenase reductase family protein [Botrytis fragariae]KAF5869036.1 putative short chain dehydrogenase reductase family protein [Botrytis fragariae]